MPWPQRQNETPTERSRSSLPPIADRGRTTAFYPNVGLIHPPGFVGRLQMRSSPLLKFRCIVLNPSPDRRMVDLQAALDQQLLDITIGKGVAKVPSNGTKNDLGCEVAAT